jgi:shikimate dehydrogenase
MVIGNTGALMPPCDAPIANHRVDARPRDSRVPRDVPTAASVAEFIRGTTLLYPVLGSPIAQVKAPMLYNALFARTGLDAAVVPIEIAPEDYPVVLKALFRAKNVPGAFVTIPHKAATVALLDDCSDAVSIAGACNAVVRRADGTLYGDLFDGIGFVHAVEKHGFSVAGARCLVVGAGGAGAAIAAALADAGAGAVRLHDTRRAHAEALAAQLRAHFPRTDIDAGPATLAGFALIVNATPLGMEAGDPLPVDVGQITPQMVVAEIVMKREITPMLAAARQRGCRIVLGREMLQEQMPLYLEFFGLPPAPAEAPPYAGVAA